MTLYKEQPRFPFAVIVLLIMTILVLIYLFHSIDRYRAEEEDPFLLQHTKYYAQVTTEHVKHTFTSF